MIVVADTSVVLNLCRVQHEHLLKQLFKQVLIPRAVADEFDRLSKMRTNFAGLILPGGIEIMPSPSSYPNEVLAARLDLGESAAIALCLEQKADALLIDESLGREVATRLGIQTVGILGILVQAKRQKLIGAVKTVLEKLETDAGFWVATDLKIRVLQLAGE